MPGGPGGHRIKTKTNSVGRDIADIDWRLERLLDSYQAASLHLVDAAPHNRGDEVAGVSLPLQHSLQVDSE